MNKIAVCTIYDDKFLHLSELSLPILEKYCKLNNYDLIVKKYENYENQIKFSDTNHALNAAWSKLNVIKDNIEKYEYILWIDIDAIIMKNKPIEHVIKCDPEADLYCLGKDKFNSGVFLLKTRSFEKIITKCLEYGFNDGDAYEQDSLNKSVQFFASTENYKTKSCWIQGFCKHFDSNSCDYIIHFPWGSFEEKFKNKLNAMLHYLQFSDLYEEENDPKDKRKEFGYIIPIYDKNGYKYLTQALLQIASFRKYDNLTSLHIVDFTKRDNMQLIENAKTKLNFEYSYLSEKITDDDRYDSLMCNKFKAAIHSLEIYKKIFIVDSDLVWFKKIDFDNKYIRGTFSLKWNNDKVMISDHLMCGSKKEDFSLIVETFLNIRNNSLDYKDICSRNYESYNCLNSEWLLEIIHHKYNIIKDIKTFCKVDDTIYFHYASWKKETPEFKMKMTQSEEYNIVKAIFKNFGITNVIF
jgi:hypothetical protein